MSKKLVDVTCKSCGKNFKKRSCTITRWNGNCQKCGRKPMHDLMRGAIENSRRSSRPYWVDREANS